MLTVHINKLGAQLGPCVLSTIKSPNPVSRKCKFKVMRITLLEHV